MRAAGPICLAILLCLGACDSGSASDLPGGNGPDPQQQEDVTPPAAPTGLEGTLEEEAILLQWDASQGEVLAGYNVYRSESSFAEVGDAQQLNEGTSVSEASYRDEELEVGTAYFYRVTAVDEAGNESNLSRNTKKTLFPDPPDEP